MKLLRTPSKQAVMETEKACTRRGILKGSAALIVGGIAGLAGCGKKEPEAAPPLPWKWVELDPNEAGRRAYQNYLKNKG